MSPEAMSPEDSTDIQVASGVSAFTGEPFCHVTINGVSRGQMSPQEVREMALQWLAAAEAAESDAAVWAELTKTLELPQETAAAFLHAMRERRGH